MPLLPELARSYLDLWHHFDGIEAGRTDRFGPAPVLASFDSTTEKQHGAAFRSLAHAIEELELDALDEEIDRTVLIDSLRVRLRRIEHDRPGRWNPALWLDRVLAVIQARPEDPALFEAIPGWTAALRNSVTKPPIGHLQVALELLAEVRERVADPGAAEALAGLDSFLRLDVEADGAPAAGSLGEDQVTWHLHHEFKIELTAAQAERRLTALVEASAAQLEAGQPLAASVGAEARVAAGAEPREIRRRLAAPEWLAAIDLASGYVPAGERHVALVIAGLDLAIQLGRIGSAEGVARLTDRLPTRRDRVRRVLVAPLEAAGAALLAAEWVELARMRGETPAATISAASTLGVFHPALAAWRLGADD